MKPDFYIGQGDSPLWQDTLVDANGAPVLIQNAVVTLTMTPITGGNAILNGVSVSNLDDGTTPNKGKVQRQFSASETTPPGGYLVKVYATLASKTITYPNSGFLFWEIGPSAAAQASRYLGVEEFKDSRGLAGFQFADHDAAIAVESASRALEVAYNNGAQWTLGADGEQRFYTRSGPRTLALGDVIKITSVDLDFGYDLDFVDDSGDNGVLDEWPWAAGAYATNLPSGSYSTLPVSPKPGLAAAGGDGSPFQELHLSRASSIYILPRGRDAIRITGQYGWETVPAGVKWCVTLVATRMMKRSREAPWGVASFGQDVAVATIRQFQQDPEFQLAMNGVQKRQKQFV